MATICINGDPFYLSMILEARSLEIEVSGSLVPSEASPRLVAGHLPVPSPGLCSACVSVS